MSPDYGSKSGEPMFARDQVRNGSPRVTGFLHTELGKLPAPRNVKERNLAQLMLARRLTERFDFDDDPRRALVKAVEAVAPLYGNKFPH